jgi:hypothetical protein
LWYMKSAQEECGKLRQAALENEAEANEPKELAIEAREETKGLKESNRTLKKQSKYFREKIGNSARAGNSPLLLLIRSLLSNLKNSMENRRI